MFVGKIHENNSGNQFVTGPAPSSINIEDYRRLESSIKSITLLSRIYFLYN
jgi:hypothetical protein